MAPTRALVTVKGSTVFINDQVSARFFLEGLLQRTALTVDPCEDVSFGQALIDDFKKRVNSISQEVGAQMAVTTSTSTPCATGGAAYRKARDAAPVVAECIRRSSRLAGEAKHDLSGVPTVAAASSLRTRVLLAPPSDCSVNEGHQLPVAATESPVLGVDTEIEAATVSSGSERSRYLAVNKGRPRQKNRGQKAKTSLQAQPSGSPPSSSPIPETSDPEFEFELKDEVFQEVPDMFDASFQTDLIGFMRNKLDDVGLLDLTLRHAPDNDGLEVIVLASNTKALFSGTRLKDLTGCVRSQFAISDGLFSILVDRA